MNARVCEQDYDMPYRTFMLYEAFTVKLIESNDSQGFKGTRVHVVKTPPYL